MAFQGQEQFGADAQPEVPVAGQDQQAAQGAETQAGSAGQFGAPEAGGDQTQAPVAPEFNSQHWALNYRGQQSFPRDRNHLIDLAQKGQGYERGQEELNRMKTEYAQKEAGFQKYADLENRFNSDPTFAQKVWDLNNQQVNGGVQESYEQDPRYDNLLGEVNTLKESLQFQQSEQADTSLNTEIRELQSNPTFQGQDWNMDNGYGSLTNRVMQHSLDGNFPSLAAAAKDYLWDSMQSRTAGKVLKTSADQIQANHRQGIMNANSAPPPPAQPLDFSKETYNSLAEKAVHMLQNS